MLSSTVTVAIHTAVLLFASVTVSVTELSPIFEQSNVVFDAANVTVQASLEPPSISAAVILAVPATSN